MNEYSKIWQSPGDRGPGTQEPLYSINCCSDSNYHSTEKICPKLLGLTRSGKQNFKKQKLILSFPPVATVSLYLTENLDAEGFVVSMISYTVP